MVYTSTVHSLVKPFFVSKNEGVSIGWLSTQVHIIAELSVVDSIQQVIGT